MLMTITTVLAFDPAREQQAITAFERKNAEKPQEEQFRVASNTTTAITYESVYQREVIFSA